MSEIEVPCPTCAGTGDSTCEDRHTGTNMDTCRTCGGRRTIPARPGESRETSWPFAVPGTVQPVAPATPSPEGEGEGLIREAYDMGFASSSEGWNGEHPGDAAEQEHYARRREDQLFGLLSRISPTPSLQTQGAINPPDRREEGSFQDRSAAWMGGAFKDDPTDGPERRDRTAEEVCEGYQADGGTLEDWIAIGRYTFGRPTGLLPKEIGQIAFTLACWAAYRDIDMMAEAERELARCSTPEFIDKLARKRATRHGRGPLPGFSGPETSNPGFDPAPPRPSQKEQGDA